MKSVLVGLSGGVDSAITALLLKDKGYRVTGVHFNFTGDNQKEQKEKLTELKNMLDIEIIEHNSKQLFDFEVINYFTRLHLAGKTPSPCIHCNPAVKWKLLYELANENNIDFFATGHYVQILNQNNLSRIYRGIDLKKDQSYYLWRLDQNILNRALTPLGNYRKADVKKLALDNGYGFLKNEKESSGLCFSQGRDYEKMLNDYIPGLSHKIMSGNVVDKDGKIIGRHKGYIFYTIGQKKGLELDINDRLCVASIDASKNEIVADTWQSLYKNEFIIEDYVFPNLEELGENNDIRTVIRGFGINPSGKTKIFPLADNLIKVQLETPAWAPAPGQPAVFYSDNKLLGGGIIC
jgi:tRNA-uridine 2-sulfurtransferase